MEKYVFSKEEQAVFEGLSQAFAVYQFVDKKVVTIALSDGFCELFGYEDKAQAYFDMDHNMYRNTHPDDTARISDAAYHFAKDDVPYDIIYRSKKRNGSEYRVIHSVGKHIYTESGVRLAQVWYTDEGVYSEENSSQVTELNCLLSKALREKSLVKASYFDHLTGLPGMTYFFDLAETGMEAIVKAGGHPALLFIDLSGMKYYNSKHGFSAGDKLLQCFAKSLIETFNSEQCCHISGDHFLAYTDEDGLEDRLNSLFSTCCKLNDGQSLPMRVGIYPTSLGDVPVSVACDRAKFACDSLRNKFESCYSYYNKEMTDEAERRQYILTNIDRAISERWIKVYYQPIVRAVTTRVCDEEALARWIDPVKGFLSPGYFIPYLEEAGLIYKLDLYMLEQVLEKIKYQRTMGFHIVPHSINFSRSDFTACDLVEEVRRRVDDAGVEHDKITIEVTESAVGDNFDFMKEQIERFQQLGFPVWMDDFGSGYSSLDVLSSIKFNLLKFDLIFMKKFEEEDSRKVILTELMRMATSLGIDTVCEGVETEKQVRFLQEIGCNKLQGFYFDRPIPLEKILEKYKNGTQIGYEDPSDLSYFETIGRVNLYDLSIIANVDGNEFNNIFNTIPMAVMEIKDNNVHIMRSNPSYRDFIKRYLKQDSAGFSLNMDVEESDYNFGFINFIKQCCMTGNRLVYDGKMHDGSIVHCFSRRLVYDPDSGRTALAIAILSITKPDEGTTYANIARALAADYYNIYYVDLVTEHFIEYSSPVGGEDLAFERHGEEFFAAARRDTLTRIYEDDREPFITGFTKENVIRELDENGSFSTSYRLIDTGVPMYVNMKIMRMYPDMNHIIIGISVVDSQMKQHELNETKQREAVAAARIMALSGGYLSIYSIDLETGSYYLYSDTKDYKEYDLNETGDDIFLDGAKNGKDTIFEEDYPDFVKAFTKENVLREINENGSFSLRYRLIIRGEAKPVLLKVVPVCEGGTEKLIAGVRLWRERS